MSPRAHRDPEAHATYPVITVFTDGAVAVDDTSPLILRYMYRRIHVDHVAFDLQ